VHKTPARPALTGSRRPFSLLRLGTLSRGRSQPFGPNIMIAGLSGSGKTTLATGILEQLVERGYQFCLLDPEGDYEGFDGPIEMGGVGRPPNPDEVVRRFSNRIAAYQ
jgi:DNA helicase HerA-like ATPase